MHHNPRRHYRRHYRRNPRGMRGIMSGTVIPATVGATGAVLLNLAMGYLPATFQTSIAGNALLKPLVGIGGAILLGMGASKIAGRQAGERVALGAVTVVLYGLINNTLKTALPNLPLSGMPRVGWVNPGMPVGMYAGTAPSRTVQPMQHTPQVGMYVGVPGY
jgi:hypothetical protein